MDIQRSLERLGLDSGEATLYLAALRLGEASITDLAKAAEMKRPTAYLAAAELEIAGLLAVVKRGKRRIFSPIHPRRLLGIAQTRLRDIEDAIPSLVALHNTPKEKPKIQVFEGLGGVQSLYEDLYQSLKNKEEALWFANIGALQKMPVGVIAGYKQMIKRLGNPRIRELNFGDEEGKRWVEEVRLIQGKNHFVRILPTDFPFGATDGLIFGDKLVVFSLKKDIFVLVIESVDIAQTFRAMFEWAWKQGA